MNMVQNKALEQFKTSLVMKIEGLHKQAYLDDFENGESLNGHWSSIDFIKEEIELSGTENKEQLTDIIVNVFKENLYDDEINKNHLSLASDTISCSVLENEDGESLTSKEVKYNFDNDIKVYACYYDVKISINGVRLNETQLIELFDIQF